MLQWQCDAYINEITGHGFRAMARTILDEVLEVLPEEGLNEARQASGYDNSVGPPDKPFPAEL
jgi:hypothetical protein